MSKCARHCVLTHWLFSCSLQMLTSIGHWKFQIDTMKAYGKHSRKQRQYNYQLSYVTPENALLISICILMLPMVHRLAEHAQLATTYHVNPTNQWYVHMPLMLPWPLDNVLPAIVLQNCVLRLDIARPSYTSSHFSVCHTPCSLCLHLLSSIRRSMVVVVLVLLLLLSGDIETNPGPVGELC